MVHLHRRVPQAEPDLPPSTHVMTVPDEELRAEPLFWIVLLRFLEMGLVATPQTWASTPANCPYTVR